MNEILSTIQDLQNNPTASKLPNTEFHNQQQQQHNPTNNKTKSSKCGGDAVVEHRLSSSSPPHHHHHKVVDEIAAVEEVSMVVPCHEEPIEDKVNFRTTAPSVIEARASPITLRDRSGEDPKSFFRCPNKVTLYICLRLSESNTALSKYLFNY